MNGRTAKLLNRFAPLNGESRTKAKRDWRELNFREKFHARRWMARKVRQTNERRKRQTHR